MNLHRVGMLLCTMMINYISIVKSNYCTGDHNAPTNQSYSLMETFCNEQLGEIVGRQCKLDNETRGLDLSNCGGNEMVNLPVDVKVTLQWLAINNNSFNLNQSINYLRSTNVTYLIIDLEDTCTYFENSTFQNGLMICSKPTDACNTTKDLCPEHSGCTIDGPGLFACDCVKDWESYKCLKKKNFPYEEWLISICVATVVLIVVMRLLQHKDLKKGAEYKKMAQLSNTDFPNPEREGGLFG